MSPHRAWWPHAPWDRTKTKTPPPPSPSPEFSIPPQYLWPHHALPGNLSPIITAAISSPSSSNTNVQLNPENPMLCSALPSPLTPLENHHPDHPPDKNISPIRPLYVGIFLSGPSKHRLLDRYPPHHATIYAHHVTLQYFGYEGIASTDMTTCIEDFPLGATVAMSIIGSAADDYCQALEVTVPSWVRYNNTFVPPHVTVSVVESTESRDAGILVKESKAQGKIEPVHGLRVLHGIVGVCLTDRSVVYSEEELREAMDINLNLTNHGGDSDENGSNDGVSKEPLPLSPPLPSSRLLNHLEKGKKEISSSSCTTKIDLVSLLHQCFTPLPPPAAQTTATAACLDHPHLAEQSSPLASISSYAAFSNTTNNRRKLNSRQQQSSTRPSSTKNLNASSTNKIKRQGQQTGIAGTSTSAAVSVSGGGVWWKTSSIRVTTAKINDNCSNSIEQELEQITQTAVGASQHHAFQLDLEAAENERATMHAHHTAYKTALSTSKRAKSTGNYASARQHTAAAHRHASAFLAARQRSSAAAFHAHNASILNTFKIDLHGMHVTEALAVLRKYVEGLAALGHPGGVLLKIVTGFGQHSRIPGRAKVLPAVVEYLAELGVLFDVEEENPGMVRVLFEPHWNE